MLKMQCTMQLVQIFKYVLQHIDKRHTLDDCKLHTGTLEKAD